MIRQVGTLYAELDEWNAKSEAGDAVLRFLELPSALT
jgi:hypothetical protein